MLSLKSWRTQALCTRVSPVYWSYNITGNYDSVDICFNHTKCPNPNPHIKTICCKAQKVLNFIIRIYKELDTNSIASSVSWSTIWIDRWCDQSCMDP